VALIGILLRDLGPARAGGRPGLDPAPAYAVAASEVGLTDAQLFRIYIDAEAAAFAR
jgi:hypothetical protein